MPTGRASPSAPFFFKLKRPYYAIAGFGTFARSSLLPAWLARESFQEKNGAPDFQTMRRRIEKYLDKDPNDEALKRLEPLVRETDRLDAAQLTPDDVENPRDYILLGYTIDSRSGLGGFEEYFRKLVELLKTKSIAEVLTRLSATQQRRVREAFGDLGRRHELEELLFAVLGEHLGIERGAPHTFAKSLGANVAGG